MQAVATTLVLLAVVAAPLAAQTTTAPPAAPPPHIVIDTVGPDGWRMRLGPTNLANLLASEKGRALWQPGVAPLLGAWQQLLGDEKEFAAARDRLLGYGGRVQLALHIGDSTAANPAARAALVLDSDGHTDLKALAADLRRLQQQLPGEWQQRTVEGQELEVRVGGNDEVTAPQVAGDRILFAAASDGALDEALALARSLAGTAAPTKLPPTSPVLHLHIHAKAIADMVAREAGLVDGEGVLRALGVPCLGDASVTIGTAGPHVQVEVAQRFVDEPRGLFGALFPTSTGVSSLQSLVAGDATAWKVGRFDWRAMWTTILDLAIVLDFTEAPTREQMTKEIVADLGFDPDADMFAHMTDEVSLELRFVDLDRLEHVGWVMAVALRDAAAFEKGVKKWLAENKATMTRAETTRAGDVEVHRYAVMFGYDVWLAVGHGRFFAAGGRGAEDTIVARIATAAAEEPAAKTPASDAFRDLQRHLPPGAHGLARGEFHSVLMVPAEVWLGVLPFDSRGARPDDDARAAALELLRDHHLATVRTATGYADRTWRWRLYW